MVSEQIERNPGGFRVEKVEVEEMWMEQGILLSL